MYNKLSLSIALYGLLLTPSSPLGVFESYNIVDFVNRNNQTGDQSKPNLVSDFETHYPLSYQSPNILTNIEGVPNLDTQQFVRVHSGEIENIERLQVMKLPKSSLPQYVIEVSPIIVTTISALRFEEEGDLLEGETIYIVEQVVDASTMREMK